MWETIDLKNWEEFEQKLHFPSNEELLGKAVTAKIPIFYRGQVDADRMALETTLQRLQREIKGDFCYLLDNYIREAIAVCGVIDTHNNSDWNLDNGDITFKTYRELIGVSPNTVKIRKRIIEYLVFLRHNGFPSPLLDWSKSPYVAAFFAFSEIPKESQKVAIYEYCEMPFGRKMPPEGGPVIETIEYNWKTHKRHYLQQGCYTICLKNYGVSQGFGNYEEAFQASAEYNCLLNGTHRQDSIIKYTLPASEQKKVLRKLDKMNINHFSLFETNEALLKTWVLREFILKNE